MQRAFSPELAEALSEIEGEVEGEGSHLYENHRILRFAHNVGVLHIIVRAFQLKVGICTEKK